MNHYLAQWYRHVLAEQEKHGTFETKRLGVQWNVAYLYILKAYISVVTGWKPEQVLSVMTYVIRGAHLTLKKRPSPVLRSLIQKAICNFEQNPKNARIIDRLQRSAVHPQELYRMFPPVSQVTFVPPAQ